jgi:hypothetical protein
MENGSMAVRLPTSTVSISIDSETDSHLSNRNPAVGSVLAELLDRCGGYEIAATWAFHNPAEELLAARIAAAAVAHEIAVFDDSASAHSQFSRSFLINGLGRRIRAAAAAGFTISTLAVFENWQPRNVDLLTKFGVTMVRGRRPLRRDGHGALRMSRGIQGICYGLWHVPSSSAVSGGKWLANRLQLRQVCRAIDRAIDRDEHCHLRIDAAALAEGDISDTLRTIDRWLRQLAQWRDSGRIGVVTLRDTVGKISPRRPAAAHSILRAA